MILNTLAYSLLSMVILTLTSIIVLPVSATALPVASGVPAAGPSDSAGGAACDLPPDLKVDDSGEDRRGTGSPVMDTRAPEKYSMATFAMG